MKASSRFGGVSLPPLHRASWPLAHGFHRKGDSGESAAGHLHGAWLPQHHLTSNQSAARWAPFAKPALAERRS